MSCVTTINQVSGQARVCLRLSDFTCIMKIIVIPYEGNSTPTQLN